MSKPQARKLGAYLLTTAKRGGNNPRSRRDDNRGGVTLRVWAYRQNPTEEDKPKADQQAPTDTPTEQAKGRNSLTACRIIPREDARPRIGRDAHHEAKECLNRPKTKQVNQCGIYIFVVLFLCCLILSVAMICERRKSEELDKALKALKNGLGYNLEDIRGEQFKGYEVGRARRIFCQYLKGAGFDLLEICELLDMNPNKVQPYTWRKTQVERKDIYQRRQRRFSLSVKQLTADDHPQG